MSKWKCANPDLSLRLKELRVQQDASERVWVTRDYGWALTRRDILTKHGDGMDTLEFVAAYDGSELGVMLGEYRNMGAKAVGQTSEADERAAWLILLLENGNVTADEVNGRLEK